jgi:hypothetical protein
MLNNMPVLKSFSIDYYILVTVAAFGVLQIAASLGGLKGLSIFRSAVATRLFGFGLPLAAVIWFFGTADRNISDHLGGLSSNEVALAFFLGTMTAWLLTVVVTSVINARTHRGGASPRFGLHALKDATYFRALSQSLRYWSREWRTQTKSYFSE